MTGRIIKGIGGFYYIRVDGDSEDAGMIYECHARGIFRKEKKRPLVGDRVRIERVMGEDGLIGSIEEIFPRENELIRPEASNVDQAIIVFAVRSPEPNLTLTDSFIIQMMMQDIPVILLFNKKDLADEETVEMMIDAYKASGVKCLAVSAKNEEDLRHVAADLEGKISILAGPSGVGKSTILNALCPGAGMETGEIGKKSKRGKHTTRHSELFMIGCMTRDGAIKDSYIMDTPGFTSFSVPDMSENVLRAYYPEFFPYEGKCRFNECSHTHEPDCAVKDAVEEGCVNRIRYMNYKSLYKELSERRKYR